MSSTCVHHLQKALLTVALCLAFACASELQPDESRPQILELQQQELVIGQSLYLYGKNFSDEAYQVNRVLFQGTYTTDQGQVEQVELTMTPTFDGTFQRNGEKIQLLRVNRVGPFNNPFTSTNRPGIFDGTVTGLVEDDNGDYFRDTAPKAFSLQIGPSIYIEEFQPVDADCGEPALRALEGIAYRLKVSVAGIAPIRYVYDFNQINGVPFTTYEHDFSSSGAPRSEDTVGETEPVFFNPIEEGEQFSVVSIRVRAYDAEGNVAETALPLTVHRALEVYYDGKREIAEYYDPTPVSGCIPGSLGTRVQYTERRSEFRQRTVSMTVSQKWLRSDGQGLSRGWMEGVTEGQSQTRGRSGSQSEEERLSESMGLSYNSSNSNTVNFSESDGENWSWSTTEGESNSEYTERMSSLYGSGSWSSTVTATAEGSVPFLAKASGKVSTKGGVKVGGETGETEGNAFESNTQRGYTTSGSTNEGSSFGSVTSESQGQSLNNSYALGRVSTATASENESLSSNRTWNLSGNESSNEVVSTSEQLAQTLTVSSSTNESTTQSFAGFIPNEKFGIFYRQTTRWVRRAEVRAYNLCGLSRHVGELVFNEYTWAPDLAVSTSCEDQPPAPNLPEAGCFIQPCGG